MNPILRTISCLAILAAALGTSPGCQNQSNNATSASPDTRTYSFWPAFPDEPKIQFLTSYSSSEDVEPTKTSGLERIVFGKEAAKEALIQKPYGVAYRAGKIYVADMRGKALVVLDLKKKQTRLVGVSGINRLEHPVAVAVADDDGVIYVADNDRGAVFVYDAAERYSQVIGFPKFKPVSVAVHGERLYAADITGQNVVYFDRKSGKKLGTIGTMGDEDGQFRVPLSVATDREGNIYVMDMMLCRLQKFSADGVFISKYGQLGDYQGTFARPKHMAVDSDGLIYVVDAAFENVQMFDPEYHLLMHFGALGEFPGAMDLPAGIAVSDECPELFKDLVHPGFDARRLVIVSNQFGPTKIVVYAMGQRRPEYSAADLAKASAKLPTGTGAPDEERLRLQNPIGMEPPPEPAPDGQPGKPGQPTAPKEPVVPR
jgi:sugar lactone lactonase YvrE